MLVVQSPHHFAELPGRAFNVRYLAIAQSLKIYDDDDADELLSLLPPEHKISASSEKVRYFEARVRRAFRRMQNDPSSLERYAAKMDFERDSKNLEHCRRALEEKRTQRGRNAEIDKLINRVADFQVEMAGDVETLGKRVYKMSVNESPASRLHQCRQRLKQAKAEYKQAKQMLMRKLNSA